MLYTVKITETLSKKVTLEADNEEDAYESARTLYYDEVIVLSSENYEDTTFEILEVKNDN
jgi:hypothetical protein